MNNIESSDFKNEENMLEDMEENPKEHHLTEKFLRNSLDKELEIILKGEEKIKGTVRWFDKWNIKLDIADGTECIIFRHAIKGYIP